MSKNVKIILVIIIIILVGLSTYIIGTNFNTIVESNKIKDDKIDNKEEIKNYDFPTEDELKNMKESEFIDTYSNIFSKSNEYINKTFKDLGFSYYNLRLVSSADSVQDAIEKTEIVKINNIKILEVNLQDETDYYYVIYQKYIRNETPYKYYYLYFKNSVLDVNSKTINTNIFNNANKVKEILDLYIAGKVANKGLKISPSEITENSNEYIYTYYYSIPFILDLSGDVFSLSKCTICINKENGEYEYNINEVRSIYRQETEQGYIYN